MPKVGHQAQPALVIVKLVIRPQHVLHEAETLIIGGAGNVSWYQKWGWFLKCLGMLNFHQTMVSQLMYYYIELAIVRIKWGKAFCEHIENHRLMHYVSKIKILPH